MQNKLRLRYYPDEVLRKPTQKIKKFDRKLKSLADDMRELILAENAIGVAAPQVGLSIKLVVVWDGNPLTKMVAMCNPEIIKTEGDIISKESCLSFPGVWKEVPRKEKIVVKYNDVNGKAQILRADGLLAICAQHEIDHICQKLFIDL